MPKSKKIIYQLLPRLFGQAPKSNVLMGDIHQNACGKLSDITVSVLQDIKAFGVTHLWLTGLINHACSTDYLTIGVPASHPALLKGKAGSPYAIRDYYDIHPDLASDPASRMPEFGELTDRILAADLGLIIDFVPNHVSRDYRSLMLPNSEKDLGENDNNKTAFDKDNNFYYLPDEELRLYHEDKLSGHQDDYVEYPARVTGNDIFHSNPGKNDWYETVKLNYGIDYRSGKKAFSPIPDTWMKMTNILLFWAGKGVHGFRCDMAGMVPVEFWNFAIKRVKQDFPEIFFVAEIYETERYHSYIKEGLFDYLYDKVGLYDNLRQIIAGDGSTQSITAHWQSLNGLDGNMLSFLENHDEQRIASKYFAKDPWKALPGMAVSLLMNTGPGMIYFGQEFGEEASGESGYSGDDGRTSIFDYTDVPTITNWLARGHNETEAAYNNRTNLRKAYQSLLKLASHNLIAQGQFYDLMWSNEHLAFEIRSRIFAFIRHNAEEAVIIVCSFDPELAQVSIRIPEHAIMHMGQQHCSRFFLEGIYPQQTLNTLLVSQLTNSGVSIKFDRTSWSALRLVFN
ncbi:MAG: alpha-amylase [Bacteroidetes bacterium]|nr:alpha-amylase [Bacteroidota bacterium]MBT3750421.1 alpha-amylase [Bacteroidota bacterium]MBT4408581.1 alpha-amylase [Bacteroidota bacterium]MBT7462851.1 alpha-amylase [Bacteroidota bacterium]